MLGEAGRAFLLSIAAQFTFDVVQGVLLFEAAKTLDSLTFWRAQPTDPKTARQVLAHQKVFAGLIAQVGAR